MAKSGPQVVKRVDDPDAFKGDPEFMLSFARGLAVIRVFGERKSALTVADIATVTGLSKSAVRRCLHTLVCLGYAAAEGPHYVLKAKVLTLGYSYIGSVSLAKLVTPVVEGVMREIQESCSAGVLDGREIVYIARSSPQRLVSVGLAVGSRAQPFFGSMGRVFLAGMTDRELKAFLAPVKLAPPTQYSVRTIPALVKVIEKVRRDGFAVVDQELEIGARAIAVPVRDRNGTTVAALNVGVPNARVPFDELEPRFLAVLRRAAGEVEKALEAM